MQPEQIISWMIIGCILFAIFLLFSKPLKIIAKLCINGLFGICALFIGNFILSSAGLAVGINMFTAIFTALLGIPGILCLYFLRLIA